MPPGEAYDKANELHAARVPDQMTSATCPGSVSSCAGSGHLIRSRTMGLAMPMMRVKGHEGWPSCAQAPAPDDCAANDVAPGVGASFHPLCARRAVLHPNSGRAQALQMAACAFKCPVR